MASLGRKSSDVASAASGAFSSPFARRVAEAIGSVT
eukprot:CAMPEP_0172552520 /NCGR_PEP_ID=MMETSP1067-20121228/45539_1 /TAXON_ID=265564 ORGANISM="Thalassiosira punctigera, Strain Tpunct2005C2" /NCGR_SAMPLE_ID=MMETSP1067 /ASSEMBLY_ACC=CAM_ASM_000444 /LENGTH=35 /DNA_ID= /DNA_START= /DNA_END= /DNA_ORIENTATION=